MPLQQMLKQEKSKLLIELPEEALMLIRQYEEAKADEAEGAGRKTDAINKLKEMLGDNKTGKVADYIISCKNVTEETFDRELFKEDNPELYEKYLRRASYWKFSVE